MPGGGLETPMIVVKESGQSEGAGTILLEVDCLANVVKYIAQCSYESEFILHKSY